MHHLLSGCKKLVGTEYVKRHDSTLKVLAVKWAIENGLLPKDTKWYTTNWQGEKVTVKDGKKLFWDWEDWEDVDQTLLPQIHQIKQ